MRKPALMIIIHLSTAFCLQAQNVGINTPTPTGPLSFNNNLGNKIVLWGDGNVSHYGMGIQGSLLQLYSDYGQANIAFGYGRSANFTERMRIINSGGDGMDLKGRITLRNGTSPLDLNYGSGLWLYRADNTAQLGFIGVQNNQNIGFYGGPRGWGFTYNALNSRVGIGNNNPNAPLSFGPTLEKKITLYPGATGDVGFAVAGNRLQIYSDNPNADVAIGYDAAGTFNERFAVKANGALAVNGNVGTPGQVLQTNGGGSTAVWGSSTNQLFNNMYQFGSTNSINLGGIWTNPYDLPGLTQTIILAQKSNVLVSMHIAGRNENVFGDVNPEFYLSINSSYPNFFSYLSATATPGRSFNDDTGFRMITLDPGSYTFKMYVRNPGSGSVTYYDGSAAYGNRMIIVVVPQ